MKAIACSILFLMLLGPLAAQNLHLEKSGQDDKIVFAVLKEANIYSYVVEGSDDTLNFEIIGVVSAKGYSMAPLNYSFVNYGKSYTNYRVKQIDMNGLCVQQMEVRRTQSRDRLSALSAK